jgi:glucose-1-phosphate adenylyltransferase
VIERGAEVGSPDTDPDDSDAIVLVGRGSTVGAGVTLEVGARLEPGSTA